MKKILAILFTCALFACNDGYNDKNDNDGVDTSISKKDSTVKDTAVQGDTTPIFLDTTKK